VSDETGPHLPRSQPGVGEGGKRSLQRFAAIATRMDGWRPSFLSVLRMLALLSAFALATTAHAYDARGFELSRAFYETGEYDNAAKALRDPAGDAQRPGRTSPGLLHNLGNSEFKLGRLGFAILAWERARALDPFFRNTMANLRFARGEAGLTEPEFAWHEKYSALLPPDAWIWTAAGAFWIAAALLALPTLVKRKRTAWTQGGAVVAIGVFLLTVPALTGIAARGKIGVVVATDSLLRLTPTKEGETLGKLTEGELARVEKARGEYLYVRGASDRAGWVRQEEFAKIWP